MSNKYYDGALKLYGKAKIGFIGSVDGGGFPNIKAVLLAEKKDNMHEVVIKTNTSSCHIQQFSQNPKGCLYFYSLIDFKGVMLKGTFKIVEDSDLKRHYWKRGDEKYYRKGDHDYCLLIFTAQSGRYYHRYDSGDFDVI